MNNLVLNITKEELIKTLTHDETENLLHLSKKGGEIGKNAIEKLIKANIGLIYKIKNRYRSFITPTFDEDDLFSTALIGFVRAAQLFKFNNGNKFHAYAGASMHYQIWRAIETQSTALRLPVRIQREKNKILKAKSLLLQQYHRDPTINEVSKIVGISEERINYLLSLPIVSKSLDDPVYKDSKLVVGDCLVDKSDYFRFFNRRINRSILFNFIKSVLNKKELSIILMHYGLTCLSEEGLNFSEISKILKIRSKYVRRIHDVAIKKLMSNNNKDSIVKILT